MDNAPDLLPHDMKTQAAYYRTRAFEVRKRAVEVNWTGLKTSFLQIAEFYDKLARQLEAAPPENLARPAASAPPNVSEKLNP